MRRPAVKAKATARQPKVRVKGDVSPLDYTLRLMETIGPTATAKAIGTTPGTLHKARNAGAITTSLEVASRGVWNEQGFAAAERAVESPPPFARTTDLGAASPSPTSETVSLLLIQVPRERAAMLQRAAESLGAAVISHD